MFCSCRISTDKRVARSLCHSRATCYNFLREVCSVIVQEQSEPIGGPGKIVEIDESKFGKRKYNRGKRVDGVWVFGGIERDSNPPKCFFVPVPDRSPSTLIPIILQWILPGTIIASDCWKAYSSLQSEGYIHNTVNHKLQFVSDTGTHTNHIESRWHAFKSSLPRLEFERSTKKRIRLSTRFYILHFGRLRTWFDLAYQATRAVFKHTVQWCNNAVTCKRHLVHEFFAKYTLQIGYLTHCTIVSKCYLHLFVFCFISINNTFINFYLFCLFTEWHRFRSRRSA